MDLSSLAATNAGQSSDNLHDDSRDLLFMALQHKHDRDMQKRSVQGTMKLNEQMAGLARDARISSAMDQVAGLRAAGLNPALAQGGSFGTVSSGGGAPAPSTSAPMGQRGQMASLALEQLKYVRSERDLMASQSEKNRAEAEAARATVGPKDWETENLKAEFEMTNSLIQDWIDRHLTSADPEEKATAQFMRAQNEAYGVGALRALNAWQQFTADQKRRAADIAKDEYEKAIYDLRNKNDVARVIYDLPKHERQALITDIAKTGQEILNLRSAKDLTEAQINEVDAHLKEITQRAAKIYHSDPAAMMDNDDWRNIVIYYGEKLVDGTLQIAPNAVGAKILKGGGKSGELAPLSTEPQYIPVNIKTPMQQLGY